MIPDTTSLYFEGAGGQKWGRHGFSKEHRPDPRQTIFAVVIDGDGRPLCSEMWPGNTVDVTTLVPVIERLRAGASLSPAVRVVADRGLISAESLASLRHAVCSIFSAYASARTSCARTRAGGSRALRAAGDEQTW
jgi:transposase